MFQQRRLSVLLVFIELSSPQAINHNGGFRPSVTQSSHPTGTLVVRGSRVKKEVHASLRYTNGSQHCMFPKTGPCLFPANEPCLRGFETGAGASTAGFNSEMGLSESVLSLKLFRRPCQILVPDKEPFFSAMPSGRTISWNPFR